MTMRLSSCALLFGAATVLALPLAATAFAPREDGLGDVPAAVTPISADELRASSPLETSVLAEINKVRTNPSSYADSLTSSEVHFRERDVENAITFLRAAPAVSPLSSDVNLSSIAIGHANYLGPIGELSHTGYGGSTLGSRYRDQGWIATLPAEELTVGRPNARQLVINLIIDAGVPGTPHRRDLMNPVFTFAGVGCGPHRTFGHVCVINLSNPPMLHREWEEAMFDDDLGMRPGWRRKPGPPVSTPVSPDASLMDDRDEHRAPATPPTQYGPEDSLMDDRDDHPKPH